MASFESGRNHAYILTGSNLGDREKNLQQAMHLLGEYSNLLNESSIFETAAWGKTDQPEFLNQVLLVSTADDAPTLMKEILFIEEKMGRTRKEKYGPRLVDIDILFFNNDIIYSDQLVIPHPQLQNRRFVLEPLHEIAPQLLHPVFNKTIHQLLIACPDPLDVKKFLRI